MEALGALRSGVRRAYGIFLAYVIATVKELGTDRVLEVLSRTIRRRGSADGQELVSRLGLQGRTDLEAGLAVYGAFLSDAETEYQVVERSDRRATLKMSGCPIFDGYHAAGMTCDYLTENLCRNITLPLMTAVVSQVNPELKVKLKKFRASPDDFCLEELTLEPIAQKSGKEK